MRKAIHYCLAAAVTALSPVCSAADAADAISERIYFLQQDGRQALVYTTSRTDYSDYNIWFNNRDGYGPEDYLRNFLYMFPNSGEWSNDSDADYAILKLPQGNFASMEWVNLEDDNRLQVNDDGVYYYRNWDGQSRTPDGHYGLWNSPGAFEQIAYSWVFPDNLEPVVFEANHEGEWVQRHNTITYYGKNVNDLAFNIQYRPALGDAYDDLKKLEGEGVQVEQEPTGIKVTMAETLLFPTGIAEITSEGKAVLDRLAENLKERSSLNVIIAGHTDNVPIGPGLADRYPTNWELASARSLNIIHHLVSRDVAETRFESQAFSFMRPIDSNETEEGRAKNRRIEVLLSEPG